MGKLRVLSGRDVCRILEQHGFQMVCQRGSHLFPITLNFESDRSNRLFGKTGSLAWPSRSERRHKAIGLIAQSIECAKQDLTLGRRFELMHDTR